MYPKKLLDQIMTPDDIEKHRKAAELRRRIENKNPVHCNKCIWYKYYKYEDDGDCTHSSNKERKVTHTWLKEEVRFIYKEDPEKLNRNNDCQNFHRR